MFKFKKARIYLIMLISIIIIIAGCTTKDNPSLTGSPKEDKKVTIYSSLYVLTDLAEKIGGNLVSVVNLVPPGVSEHDYEPTAKDLANIVNGDLFLYNGAEIEGWVKSVISALDNTNVRIVDTSEGIQFIYGEHVDEYEEAGDEHEEDGDEANIDPHVWLDPLNALKQAEYIKSALIAIDPTNSEAYEVNFLQLRERIITLDEKFRRELNNVKRKEFYVSHGAFGYLAVQYGLEQNSISGLSSIAEPSPKELAKLIEEIKEHQIKYIFIESRDAVKITKTLAAEVGAELIELHAIASLTKEEQANGDDYFSLMEANINKLVIALNE